MLLMGKKYGREVVEESQRDCGVAKGENLHESVGKKTTTRPILGINQVYVLRAFV